MRKAQSIFTAVLLMSTLYGSNLWAGINYIEYREKYLNQNHSQVSETKASYDCCPCSH